MTFQGNRNTRVYIAQVEQSQELIFCICFVEREVRWAKNKPALLPGLQRQIKVNNWYGHTFLLSPFFDKYPDLSAISAALVALGDTSRFGTIVGDCPACAVIVFLVRDFTATPGDCSAVLKSGGCVSVENGRLDPGWADIASGDKMESETD